MAEKEKALSQKKSKKEVQKEIKKEEPKEPKKPRKIFVHKKAIFGALLAMIMFAALVTVGYLLFEKAFRPDPIAKILPADKTIAALEININFEHSQTIKAFDLLKDYPDYSQKKFINYLEQISGLSYDKELAPWLGRQIGIVLLESEEEVLKPIFLVETFDEAVTESLVKKTETLAYKGFNIFKTANPYYITFIGDYLVISESEKQIKLLIDSQKNDSKKLYSSADYRRIDDNMPLSKLGFLYVNFDKIDEKTLELFPFLETTKSFFKFFKNEGIALAAKDKNFMFQNFANLKAQNLEDAKYINLKQDYSAELSSLVSSDALVFFGGENIETQIKRFLESLVGSTPESLLTFDNLLENYVQKYFGTEITFENDLRPLLKNEFAVAVEHGKDGYIYKLIIELDSPETQALKIKEIADKFSSVGAFFEPKVVTHTLEDGTEGREIVAEPKEFIHEESKHKGITIYEIKIEDGSFGICYSIIDNFAVIALSLDGVKNSIDIRNGEKESLKSTRIFSEEIFPILSYSDEIFYSNLEKLLPLLFANETLPEYLKLFGIISSGQSYSDGGIGSKIYLSIR